MKQTERKRAAIIEAAREEFLIRGFRETSMDRIAERAEVSKRTVYNHFDSKEELFRVISTVLIEEMHQAARVPYAPDKSLADQLREIAEREVDLLTTEAYLATFRVLLLESAALPGLAEQALASIPEDQDPVKQWIRAAVRDGRLSVGDISIAANQFYSMLKGAFLWPVVGGYGSAPTGKARNTTVNSVVDMFLDHYQSA